MAVGLYSVDLQTAIPAEGGLIPRVIADEGGACVGRGRTDHSQVGAGDAGERDERASRRGDANDLGGQTERAEGLGGGCGMLGDGVTL